MNSAEDFASVLLVLCVSVCLSVSALAASAHV